jgi:hypothetical protein
MTLMVGVPRSVIHRPRTESPTPGIPQATTLPDERAFSGTNPRNATQLQVNECIGLLPTDDSLNS